MRTRLAVQICGEALSPLVMPCYGGRQAWTPELDRWSSQGVVLHDAYGNAKPFRVLEEGSIVAAKSAAAVNLSTESFLSLERFGCQLVCDHSGRLTEANWQQVAAFLQANQAEHADSAAIYKIRLETSACSDELQKLQIVEDLLAHLAEFSEGGVASLAEEVLLILTADRGALPSGMEVADLSFGDSLSSSLSLRLWRPLIIASTSDEFSSGCSSALWSAADLTHGIQRWLTTGEFFTASEGAAGQQRLLLQSDDLLGWRNEQELLVVEALTDSDWASVEPPERTRYFLKPEDRYDVNNLASAAGERVWEMWQELQAARKSVVL